MITIPTAPDGRSRWRRLAIVAPVLAALLAWQAAPAAADPPPAPAGAGFDVVGAAERDADFAAPVGTAPGRMGGDPGRIRAGGDPAGVGPGSNGFPMAAAGTYPVTLLTGDVAVLHVATDGRQAAWIEQPVGATPQHQPMIFERDGQVHVIPAEATPYLDAGVLDERLFNLTGLVAQGYHDLARADLPLLVTAPAEATAQSLHTPAGAQRQRVLPSVAAVSLSADKRRARAVWESLRGPQPAALGDPGAALAGAGSIALNGRFEVALGESVPAVGGPAAWQAGYDGSGVTVAVLDTGADPHHPDLSGQIIGARNFTEDIDPPGEAAVDGHGHGTHVAATVAGTGAASGGVHTGVAPGADLLIGKVLADDGFGYEDWIIAGMEWAVEQGAQVVNMSLGGGAGSDGTDLLSQAVDQLSEQSGALFVVAAGNDGPFAQSVNSPGTATRALTVGATTKDDQQAWFSSRGPRAGDLAVKPELVAPGVGIVAARAAGTELGDVVDDHYVSANGTSMAAPHVAGAAAIIAQQHPHLTGDAIKARLITTSQELAEPVDFQGAGRLDLAAAVETVIEASHGALSFGRFGTADASVSKQVTFRNTSDRRVLLRLTADVSAVNGPERPSLRLRPAALVVRPGSEATAEIEFAPRATRPDHYTGHIIVTDQHDPGTRLHLVVSAAVDPPERELTVTGVDRDGQPANGTTQLWNNRTGELFYANLHDGAASVSVPEGEYAIGYAIRTGTEFFTGSWTFGAEPELRIQRDRRLHYDARRADPVRVVTPRDSELSQFEVLWHRQAGDRSFTTHSLTGLTGEELYFLPGPAARDGLFEVSVSWQEVQPLLSTRIGADGHRLDPSPMLASQPLTYAEQASLPVVDAGTGTPAEFAELDVDGKVALVSRDDLAGIDGTKGGFGPRDELPLPPLDPPGPPPRVGLAAQADAAGEAGAQLLLVYNDQPGPWRDSIYGGTPLPVYTIDQASGEQIRQALGSDPELVLTLDGVADATYNYELAFLETKGVPAGAVYEVDEDELAVVTSDYRQNSDRMVRNESWVPYIGSTTFASSSGITRNGPVVRTEYVSTADVRWQRFGQPYEWANMYWTWSPIEQYRPEEYHRVWWGPLARPGLAAVAGAEEAGMPAGRFGDQFRLTIPQYLWGDGHAYSFSQHQTGDQARVRLSRDGELIGSWEWPELTVTVPAGEAGYELTLRVDNGEQNFMDTAVATESTWRFRSARPDDGYAVLPLLQIDYQLAAGAHNEVPAGSPYVLGIAPGYQPGFTGPGGFTVTAEISYDDGETWVAAPVSPSGGQFKAAVPAAAAGTGFASVRVVATDADGSQLTQLIERAWRVEG